MPPPSASASPGRHLLPPCVPRTRARAQALRTLLPHTRAHRRGTAAGTRDTNASDNRADSPSLCARGAQAWDEGRRDRTCTRRRTRIAKPFSDAGGGACPQRMGPRQIQAACVWSKWAGHAASDLWTCRIPRECSGSAVSSLCETEKGTTFSMSSGQKRRREWACSAREPRLRTQPRRMAPGSQVPRGNPSGGHRRHHTPMPSPP